MTETEGAVITSGSWNEYELMLGIKPEALKGETVLNFGAGGSHLGKDLTKRGINCQVIDLDLKFDPRQDILRHGFKFTIYLPIRLSHLVSKHLSLQGHITKQLFQLENKILNMQDRNFIRGDGRALPFPDQTFGHVLALWSTYQVPDDSKEIVYRELMRVGEILHIGPISGIDYNMLVKLAAELDYEIVACQTLKRDLSSWVVSVPFMFSSPRDYDIYMMEKGQNTRIQRPKGELTVTKKLGLSTGTSKNGGVNTIVLKRR